MKSLFIAVAIAVVAAGAAAQDCGGGGCDPYSNPFCECDPTTFICDLDPIMINMAGGRWQLTDANKGVPFDAQANGVTVRVGWTAANTQIAFLALDRNRNGKIDDASELFGNVTTLRDGSKARNGFAVLEQYDSNNDGVIDAKDDIWPKLLLWFDRNHDGISQPSELMPIAASGITALELGHRWTGRTDRFGNRFGYKAILHRGDVQQQYYDVFLVESP